MKVWGNGGTAAERVPAHKLLGADASRNRQKQRLVWGFFSPRKKRLPGSNTCRRAMLLVYWAPCQRHSPPPLQKRGGCLPAPKCKPREVEGSDFRVTKAFPASPRKASMLPAESILIHRTLFRSALHPPQPSLMSCSILRPEGVTRNASPFPPLLSSTCGIRAGGPAGGPGL